MDISTEIQIDLSHVKEDVEGIMERLKFLYTTRKGSVPLARDFGIDWSCLDYPTETAKSLLSAEIVDQTAKHEPTATVQEIAWDAGEHGQLIPRVVITSVKHFRARQYSANQLY